MDLEASEATKGTKEPSFSWHDITCSYAPSRTSGDKIGGGKAVQVLHGISGHVAHGDFLAVLGTCQKISSLRDVRTCSWADLFVMIAGPSGAGKSCLLDILAGRKTVGNINGSRYMDGSLVNKKAFMRATAYVVQTDLYHPTSTVKEAVLFQANLRCVASL
jgi:ABC-type lipoprotein export system ATPase subunit